MRSQVTFLHSVNKATYEELVIYILSVHITVQLRKESGISFHSSVSYAQAGSSKKNYIVVTEKKYLSLFGLWEIEDGTARLLLLLCLFCSFPPLGVTVVHVPA